MRNGGNMTPEARFNEETRLKAKAARDRAKNPSELASSIQYVEEMPKQAILKQYLEGVPLNYRLRVSRALNGEMNLLDAARLKCAECCGFEDVQQRVSECRSWRCPLWRVRLFQPGQDDGGSEVA